MILFLVERKNEIGWDEYDSAIVIAEDYIEAKQICAYKLNWRHIRYDNMSAKEIGKTHYKRKRILLSSFNAG